MAAGALVPAGTSHRSTSRREQMFVFANLLSAVAQIVNMGLSIYFYIIIARAIISWVNPDPYNPIVRFLYQATEPVLYRIRKFIPYLGGIDLSPIIAMLVIKFLQFFVVETLIDLAVRMKAGGAL